MKIIRRIAKAIRNTFDFIFSMIDALFNKHKIVRRLMAMSVLVLIIWVCVQVIPRLDGGDAVAALGLVIGLLTPVIVFYKWSRERDDRHD